MHRLRQRKERERVIASRCATASGAQQSAPQREENVIAPHAMQPTRRAMLLAPLLLASQRAHAQIGATDGPWAALPAMVAAARLGAARVGIMVVDAASGHVVYEHDADVSLNPASNAKLLTAGAALALLGPAHGFATSLHARRMVGGAVPSIMLRGGGDPSLRSVDLVELAREVAASGISRVDGEVIVDDALLGDAHLPPAFELQPQESAPFRASVSAASCDENAIHIVVRPGASVGARAEVATSLAGYADVDAQVATVQTGRPALEVRGARLDDGRERFVVRGSIPLGASPVDVWRRIEAPSLATGHALRAALRAAGIAVSGGVRVSSRASEGVPRVALHRSLPLSSLLYEVGKDSNNFYAEMLLLALGSGTEGAVEGDRFARGAARVLEWVRSLGVDTQGMVLRNGSGLFDANRVSARQLAGVLRAVWRDAAIAPEYLSMLAVGGDDGTLRGRLRVPGAPRIVRAKTGTLRDVVALSGYVMGPDPSRAWVVSVVANGVAGRVTEARSLADNVFLEVARRRDALSSAR